MPRHTPACGLCFSFIHVKLASACLSINMGACNMSLHPSRRSRNTFLAGEEGIHKIGAVAIIARRKEEKTAQCDKALGGFLLS